VLMTPTGTPPHIIMNDVASSPIGSGPDISSVIRSRLATLYLRAADSLDASAELAEEHAQRCQSTGQIEAVDAELQTARRARAAAQRGRAAASDLRSRRRP
jgi:hypothetical protein